ncbi:hypothetical protein DAPPUDRAFT_192571 [Daphnia pulex]|uniref:F-box domain-containing protein n=1 Tax=Daphnia pulex TaxID=6669 RepID=E9G0J8_DAPPU|nr:hypothetical protein DAPPUDRAFT_192571 [Daphnia pulex]|eukprot:EFX86916.1 hypothetical protein DAPPUDRAFT_192571 [Daphnia pulex]
MPFYAKDWRSPGESWIKTEDGWEKLKVLETNRKRLISDDGVFCRSADDDKENCALDNSPEPDKTKGCVPPHCQITLKCTKEVAGFNGLSDALRRLDFRSAVHDHRRFPYTAKLLELLLCQHRITNLSGCAQKSVLNVLEEIAVQAQGSQQNMHVLVKLLTDLRTIVRGDSWWGTPLGSSQLWGKHVRTIDRIGAIASSILPGHNDGDDKPKFEDLPEECVREILFRLADHRDLLSAAEACGVVQKLSAEQRLWKRLCRFHFTPVQINDDISQQTGGNQSNLETDWEDVFHRARRLFGLREDYAEILHLCRNCRCLFWKTYGHPCIVDHQQTDNKSDEPSSCDPEAFYVPVPPQAFLKFFSL